jgi:outer membrane protein OmpA-like peptidoglycan-associated protein
MGMPKLATRAWVVLMLGCAYTQCAVPSRVLAQELPDRLRASVTIGAATLISGDQTGWLGYDGMGLAGDVEFGVLLLPWLDVHAGAVPATFMHSERASGGLLAPLAGVRAGVPLSLLRPYAQIDLGAGFTGELALPFFRAALGLEVQVVTNFAIGPKFGYGQLFYPDERGNSTDARFLSFGVEIAFRPSATIDPVPTLRVTDLYRKHVRYVDERRHSRPIEKVELPAELSSLLDQAVPAARVELLAPVLFEFDSDQLEPVGVAMLHEVARELALRSDIERVEIQGYADARGDAAYNEELSSRRARRVQAWLIDHGVAAERLTVAAQGATNFIEPGSNDAAHEQNRRVVFRVKRMKGAAP